MALALSEERCRQGVLKGAFTQDLRHLATDVQLAAADAWGVGPEAVGFDFRVEDESVALGPRVHWAACLREELQQWRQHARSAGWQLPVVEPEGQAAQRAAMCLRGETLQQWAESPQDWQFSRAPQRTRTEVDWPRLQEGPMWKPLVACGAALGALC